MFVVRLLFAASLGLGVDESYMVAAGRKLQLSYFDHPPIAWWMAWGIAHLTGSESAVVVRLPFVGLFALTTFLMYRATATLFDAEAGLWAAVVLNLIPVLGITAGTWVLPDGPLFAALLGVLCCLIHALRSHGRAAWGWWSATGACAGLALCSKYSAVLTLLGAGAFLATEPISRPWLRRPHPYAAVGIALVIFLPVLIWNAGHGWVSFLFQGGRAGGSLHPVGPILAVIGQAILLGDAIARRRETGRRVRVWLGGTAAFVAVAMVLVATDVRFNWLSGTVGDLPLGRDPSLDVVDWTALRTELGSRGLLDSPGLVVAALKWHEAGKVDYALGGRVPVICLCSDARQYGLIANPDDYAGADVLILAPRRSLAQIESQFGDRFDSVELIAPATIMHAERPAMELPLFIGHRLHQSAARDASGSQE